jgi:hypothetical protein
MMKAGLILGIFAITSVAWPQAAQHQSSVQLARDPKRPFVYIEFDHSGPRPPQTPDEPRRGLWLRLTNNSVIPIVVRVRSSIDDPNMTILDDIITPQMHTFIDSRPLEYGSMPKGYGSRAHAQSSQTIKPGEGLLFSVPANHVSPGWFLQVPFQFDLPPVEHGADQPVCYAPFAWDDIPEKSRESGHVPVSPKPGTP